MAKRQATIGGGSSRRSTTTVGSIYNGFAEGNAWVGWCSLPTYYGLDATQRNGFPNKEARYDTNWSYFASLHPGIVQFCFVDGSVQSLKKDIDTTLYQELSTMAGQEVVPPDSY